MLSGDEEETDLVLLHQSRHQQRPVLRDAGFPEEEGLVPEGDLEGQV